MSEEKIVNRKPDPRLVVAIDHFVKGDLETRDWIASLKVGGYTDLYATHHGGMIKKKPHVAALIKEEQEKWDSRGDYDKVRAVEKLKALIKDCGSGDRTTKLAAIRELNKIHGLYDGEGGEDVEQEEITLEERKKILQEELKLIEELEKAPLCIAE